MLNVGIGGGIDGFEQQYPPMFRARTRGQRPVIAHDVMDDAASRPGQQRGDDETNALPRSRRRIAMHMLGAVMAQIVLLMPAAA